MAFNVVKMLINSSRANAVRMFSRLCAFNANAFCDGRPIDSSLNWLFVNLDLVQARKSLNSSSNVRSFHSSEPRIALRNSSASFLSIDAITKSQFLHGRPQHIRFSSEEAGTLKPDPRLYKLKLAQTGEGIAECELLKWLVNENDEVKQFQPVCEVQSDKATVEITSRFDGRVIKMHFFPGDMVKVGETLLDLLPSFNDDTISDLTNQPHQGSATADSKSVINSEQLPSASIFDKNSTGMSSFKKVLATPAVRHLARGYEINLDDIRGSGISGRINKVDVLQYLDFKKNEKDLYSKEDSLMGQPAIEVEDKIKDTKDVAGLQPGGLAEEISWFGGEEYMSRHKSSEDVIIPLRGFRRAMVNTMTAATSVPHFNFMEEIRMNALMEVRSNLKDPALAEGVELTFLPFIVKALSRALTRFPEINSVFKSNGNELHCKAAHNIGIAMATSNGLVVPNIKSCEALSIFQIAERLAKLRHLAEGKHLSTEDVTGGTITVSNIGMMGGTYACPLVNVPEVAIVALGKVTRLPRYDADGNIVPASIMPVCWSADHRVIDGATLAAFCEEWKRLIETPNLLLLHLA